MKKRRILLVEPAYRSKYPPLGLMKIAAYHGQLGDEVVFVRGCAAGVASQCWNRVYITTLFSFDWGITIKTVKHYQGNPQGGSREVVIGGIAASILPDLFAKETGVRPVVGRLQHPRTLDSDNGLIVDDMIPDYSILDQVDYPYACTDSYIGYATRGCVRRCRFCAVPTLEPQFVDHLELTPWVEGVRARHGEKTHLLLLDNNVLASPRLSDIVSEVKALGFRTGAKLNGRARRVDFNQGLDARLLTEERMSILAGIPVKPFRLAYDNATATYRNRFERAVRTAAGMGVDTFTTYLLYNHKDMPTDLWERIHHCVELGEELNVRISSFPMKYIPVDELDRSHVGPHWNRRYLRSIQCITLVTRGVVSARHDFFHRAFGSNHKEFLEILAMPEHYIIKRSEHEHNGAAEWRSLYRRLGPRSREQLLADASLRGRAAVRERHAAHPPGLLREALTHY